ATSILGKFNQLPEGLISIDTFWYHNLTTAAAARIIANKLEIRNSERFFMAGLLHDIGKLVMYLTEPELSRQVLKALKQPDEHKGQVEIDVFGFDHASLGAELLQHWNLPESLIEPVRYHHQPQLAEQYARETAAVSLADTIANSIEPAFSVDDDRPVQSSTLEMLGLEYDDMSYLINSTQAVFSNTVSILYPKQAI
ncbi:MAG: HDOD domain-containing protein, partial [Gammaproteobacteria bacterium]|nr:HDOD domain-containing protein [Gammaproteobacteria bacterium]